MVKKYFLSILISLFLLSCSEDELVENFSIETSTEISEELDNNPIDKKEEVILSNTSKTANWISNSQGTNGLLESAEDTNFVSLYDNTLAALVFIQEGKLDQAEHIFDFFQGKIQTELTSGSGGFYQFRDKNGENGSSTWMGDNAWLLIAINHYHEASGNIKYKYLANELENWLRSLQDQDGGLRGGFREDGREIPKISEGIITAFNAVSGYDDFHKNILRFLSQNRWDVENSTIVAWPENERYNFALDLHGLGYGILEDFPSSTLTETERYMNSQISTVSGNEVSGYCFDEDKDVIWLEGTAQMAVAYNLAGNTSKANSILAEIEKTFISSTTKNSIGIPYTTNHGTNYGSNYLWDHADLTPALSSSAWYLFAKMGFNPLSLGKQKNIPDEDKFWMKAFD
jgi:hypothetical protein